jgi:hypothetical protein
MLAQAPTEHILTGGQNDQTFDTTIRSFTFTADGADALSFDRDG